MTIEDLWQEYLAECCSPELDESSENIAAQRLIFLAGVTSAIGHVCQEPHKFGELRNSIADWIDREHAETN